MSTVRKSRLLAAGVGLLLGLGILGPDVVAQAPAVPRWAALEQTVGKEEYAEAKRLADAILQQGPPADRAKTTMVYGRILLGLGHNEEARQYLALLAKPGNDLSGGLVTAIDRAWLTALDGKSDEAIKALEKLLAENAQTIWTAEAADVLARLYLAEGEKQKAQKAVSFGLKLVEYLALKDPSLKGCYIEALLRARRQRGDRSDGAQRAYDAAEKLRLQGKFVEAGRLYTDLRAAHPKSTWAHAAGFRLGQCFEGLGRPAQAIEHWNKFIASASAGPWRG
jgi:tetratricopeptide (TPR) repeat protein